MSALYFYSGSVGECFDYQQSFGVKSGFGFNSGFEGLCVGLELYSGA